MALLRRSLPRLKVTPTAVNNLEGWEYIPPANRPHLRPVDYNNRAEVPSNFQLRGSGLHGPENADVMKLILWNRRKQKTPQMEVPSLHHLQHIYKFEGNLVYWTAAWAFLLLPFWAWSQSYANVHDHLPWMPPRTDGTKGPGPNLWFLE